MAKIKIDELGQMLSSSGLLEPVMKDATKSSISYICRAVSGKEQQWVKMMESLLAAFEEAGEEIHLCRKYILKNGKMVYAWHVEIKTKNIALIASVLPNVQAPKPTLKPQEPKMAIKGLRGRAPAYSGPDPIVPKGIQFSLKKKATDGILKDGSSAYIEEMPLPHVYKDINVPNAKGKGARRAG